MSDIEIIAAFLGGIVGGGISLAVTHFLGKYLDRRNQ